MGQVLPANAGTWEFNSYALMVDKAMLDFPTTVDGFAVGIEMLNASLARGGPKETRTSASRLSNARIRARRRAAREGSCSDLAPGSPCPLLPR